MVDNSNCAYCQEGELVAKFGIKICDLKASKVFLFKEQSHLGRCIVAYKDHAYDISELSPADRAAYFDDVAKVSKAIQDAFHPDRINYGAYNDRGYHIHFHLVPKYKDEFEWGTTFTMDPNQKRLTDEEYAQIIQKIKDRLQK